MADHVIKLQGGVPYNGENTNKIPSVIPLWITSAIYAAYFPQFTSADFQRVLKSVVHRRKHICCYEPCHGQAYTVDDGDNVGLSGGRGIPYHRSQCGCFYIMDTVL